MAGALEANMARREQILQMVGKLDEKPATLPGPDGPVDIIVRELTGQQSQDFEAAVAAKRANLLGFLLQMVIVDPETKALMFEASDRDALASLGMRGLKPVVEIAQRQSGLSDADLESIKKDLLSTPTSA